MSLKGFQVFRSRIGLKGKLNSKSEFVSQNGNDRFRLLDKQNEIELEKISI
jgi:hypothetical protein